MTDVTSLRVARTHWCWSDLPRRCHLSTDHSQWRRHRRGRRLRDLVERVHQELAATRVDAVGVVHTRAFRSLHYNRFTRESWRSVRRTRSSKLRSNSPDGRYRRGRTFLGRATRGLLGRCPVGGAGGHLCRCVPTGVTSVWPSAVAVGGIHAAVAASHAAFGTRLGQTAVGTQLAGISYTMMDVEQNSQALADVVGDAMQ